jgi:LMBR1 domain-containing protein 1
VLPYIHFLKVLAKKPTEKQSTINRLKVWIPDTVVLNDGDIPPMWLYSNAQGFVFRTDTFTSKNVISKLANYTSPDELVAVLKK